jgi:hypothetical protein
MSVVFLPIVNCWLRHIHKPRQLGSAQSALLSYIAEPLSETTRHLIEIPGKMLIGMRTIAQH